jgi:hypothetical protein
MSLVKLGQAVIKKIANSKIRIISKIEDLKKKFFDTNGKPICPTTPELLKIINQRNELVKILTQLKKQILVIDKTINPLKILLPILNTTVTLLKLSPIPVPPGTPLGTIITVGDTLSIAKEKITKIDVSVSAFEIIVEYILKTIDEILLLLKSLDILIETCANKAAQDEANALNGGIGTGAEIGIDVGVGTGTGINDGNAGGTGGNNLLLNNLLNIEDSGLINQLQSPSSNNTNTYKGFKLEIVLDDKNDTRFPKRYAVAKTPNGIIVLRGEPSFASSVDVLLDEIKFIIDRDNLTI